MTLPTTGATPRRKFVTADRFRLAYDVLNAARVPPQIFAESVELFVPRTVCGAFAAEVYLKCLLQEFGATIPRKHDLDLLFANLPKLERQKIGKLWKGQGNSTPIESALAQIATHFEDWRYVYERPQVDLDVFDFTPIHQALREFILSLHPDWREDDPQFVLPPYPSR